MWLIKVNRKAIYINNIIFIFSGKVFKIGIENLLKVLKPINYSPAKLVFTESIEKSQVPFPIFGDPFVWIDVDITIISKEYENFKFELFKFYRKIDKKV